MNKNIFERTVLTAAILLLLVAIGFAAKGENGSSPPIPKATVVEQDKASVTPKAPAEPAAGEEINWQVISSGGTKGTSANFVLNGTAGQTAVGYGSSTNFGLSHGFWQEPDGGGCCDKRGDVDDSGGIDVGDLTYLVAYLFQGGPAPPCLEEGDVDGSGSIDVGDLTYLVAYLFQGGDPPPPC